MTNIFITGATGLLGWDIVKNLLKSGDSKLYLLVRRNSHQTAAERISKLISENYSANEIEDISSRIETINGDITKKDLGINKFQLEELYGHINIIYHCAALCEFGQPLGRIRKINVFGAKNVLDFALECRKKSQFKSFHHISTLAVMGNFGGVFYEDSLDVTQEFNNTYEQSKFEGEKLIGEYRGKGLPVSIYRSNIIVGDSVTGKVTNFQMFYHPLHIFSLEIFEEIPANKALRYNLVPVDCAAKAICLISSNQDNNNKNYHLTNPNGITLDFLLDIASSYFGFQKPKIVSEKEFDFRALKGFKKKLIAPYLPYFNHKKVTFDTANFNKAIDGKGFSWPVIDRNLLLRLFKYCEDVNYITRTV